VIIASALFGHCPDPAAALAAAQARFRLSAKTDILVQRFPGLRKSTGDETTA
jgi:hypothetical protein